MDKEKYLEQRNTLISEAQGLINEGKFEEFKQKQSEIESLDNAFEESATAQANLNALENNVKSFNFNNSASVNSAVTLDEVNLNNSIIENESKEPRLYLNAWAKDMMGLQMTNEESQAFNQMNAFTHNTDNTGILIPETVMAGIWKEVGEQYPLWNDVFKTHVKGTMTLIKSETSTDAAWYEEDQEIEDGKEEFSKATLNGCELARSITVTWKLKEMAIDAFIPYIQGQLAEKMGVALAYGVVSGKGDPGTGETFKPEPMGILTALDREKNKPQIVEYSDDDPLTYEKCTQIMSLVKGIYKNKMYVYANSTTVWRGLANIVDATGRPYFVANPIAGGVGTIFGKIVKEDDSIPDGGILFGDAQNGYHSNINKEVTLDSEDYKKKRKTCYLAYGIVDGGVRTTKAFAYLKKVATIPA